MARPLMLAATFAVICLLLGGEAQSSPISPSGTALAVSAGNSLAQQIGWRGCGFWQAKCAVRWGPGTWRFGRCMWRHGCWGPPPAPPPLPPK
jgi:hypothetical protein